MGTNDQLVVIRYVLPFFIVPELNIHDFSILLSDFLGFSAILLLRKVEKQLLFLL